MQRKKSLLVTLDATQPSTVELTVREQVQLDRLVDSPAGRVAERYGALLQPGTTQLALDAGLFCFRTLSDASLRVVQGGVDVTTGKGGKDLPPPPSDAAGTATRGDDPDGVTPRLTITIN